MRGLIVPLLFLLIMPAALAGTDLPIPLENGAEAKISVSSCFRNLPSSGYAPIAVNINNDSARAQSWSFQFNSPAYSYSGGSSMAFAADLTVQSKSTRTFKLLVPLSFRGDNNYFGPLGVTVSGPWTSGKSRQQFPTGNRSGKPLSAFVAMSDTLAAPSWSRLEEEFKGKTDLAGTLFELDDLPDDWRGLAGIAGLWLTSDELNFLWPGQRAALREWVYRGGSLFVLGAADLDPQFHSTGFGQIFVKPDAGLDISQTVSAIEALKAVTLETQLGQEYGGSWKAGAALGPIKLNVSLLIGFMALFAVVAGPVNLFVFARPTRRHRLFWTTPLISLATTGALLVLIIFQDGLGGLGSRVALIYVSPTEKQDVLLQEQIARTGVLLSSSFTTKDPCYIAPIILNFSPTASKRDYENSGTNFGGEWFVSRAVQAHWIESIAPTRAGIVLVDSAKEGDASVAPVIVSNIGGVLEEVHFRDENGRTWRATNVRTGQRVTMEDEGQMPDLLPAEAGSRLRTMWNRVSDRNGYFYAISRDTGSLLGSLPSIRWQNDSVIYLGPLFNSGPRS